MIQQLCACRGRRAQGRFSIKRLHGVALALLLALAAGSAAAPGARAERPNIIVVVTDDQRNAGTLHVMPKTRRALLRGGRRFQLAFSNNPLCCPARATLLSGQYSHNHGIASNDPLSEPLRTDRMIQAVLRREGYRTALIGKYLNNWPVDRNPTGFHHWWMHEGGYTSSRWNVNGTTGTLRSYAVRYTNRRARSFVRHQQYRRAPFFLYLAPAAPHWFGIRVEPRHRNARVGSHPDTPSMRARLVDHPPGTWDERLRFNARTILAVRRAQLRVLRSVDDMVGDLVNTLRRTGQERDTLIIYTSDQGFFWGERGRLMLKDLPYDEATRVPLLMRWPGRVPRGSRDRRLVGHVDLVPTILHAARVRAPWRLDGRSLFIPRSRHRLLLEYGGLGEMIPRWAAVRTRDAHYTEWYDRPGWRQESLPAPGSEPSWRELFDLRRDPHQVRNLIPEGSRTGSEERLPALAERMAGWLRSDLGCAGSTCP